MTLWFIVIIWQSHTGQIMRQGFQNEAACERQAAHIRPESHFDGTDILAVYCVPRTVDGKAPRS